MPGFTAESDLERAVTRDERLLEGLSWGRPRRAHPEGSVARHVADLLAMIEAWGESGERRADLRVVSLVHDSFKYAVDNRRAKTGENHHAMRARRFTEEFTSDERLLAVIELHDGPYALWKRVRRGLSVPDHIMDGALARIPDVGLFARFVVLDGSTVGKRPEPVEWLLAELRRRGLPAA